MKHLLKRKIATAVLITASIAAFATLGDGGKKESRSKTFFGSKTYHYNFRTFSLKSGFNYRGATIITPEKQEKFIMLNTVVTYEKGNTTYLLPIKRKILLDKVKFSPTFTPRY
ncbi:MAG: hypothetical protein ICV81_18090 [Flavisolibacter sp.]|nr:hypothetical protein [Flavisolibacter sp.]